MPVLLLAGLVLLSSILQPMHAQQVPGYNDREEIRAESVNSVPSIIELVTSPVETVEARVEPKTTIPESLRVQGVYVYDPNSKEVAMAHNEDTPWPIASLTKVMAALVYLEENPDLNKATTLQRDDFVGGTAVRVPAGISFTGRDLLHATLMGSANNAAHALARSTNLSKAEFVERMNERAGEMGLTQTSFTEPSGLDPNNKSTPQEFAVIMNEALQNPIMHDVLTKTSYQMRPLNYGALMLGNTNRLLREALPYAMLGGKNGFTYGSAHNFAAKVVNGDQELVIVVFGDQTALQVFESTKLLAQKGFAVMSEDEN